MSRPAFAGILPSLGLASSRTLDQELDLERDQMRRLGFTDDYREGVLAFLKKRPATFTGR